MRQPRLTVKEDGRGGWIARADFGTDAQGRRVRKSKGLQGAATEAEARELAGEWLAALTCGGRPLGSLFLADLLAEYLRVREAQGLKYNTIRSYRQAAAYCNRLLPGRIVTELGPREWSLFFTELATNGGRDGQPLSNSTCNGVYQFVSGAYKYFVRNGLVDVNPLTSIDKPRVAPHESKALSESDVAALTAYLVPVMAGEAPQGGEAPPDVERAQAFGIWLALNTGMRVGEVCAVRRCDVFAARGYIHVGGTVVRARGGGAVRQEATKSGKGRNVAMGGAALEVVSAFLTWQAARFEWAAPRSPLVSVTGRYTAPDALSCAFTGLRARLGLEPGATFHTLRHTHATMCIAAGVDVRTLAERLGHADPTTTMRIYSHVMEGRDMFAAEAFGGALDALARAPDDGNQVAKQTNDLQEMDNY